MNLKSEELRLKHDKNEMRWSVIKKLLSAFLVSVFVFASIVHWSEQLIVLTFMRAFVLSKAIRLIQSALQDIRILRTKK